MIYSNFTGRVAKKAKLIDGVNGQFLSIPFNGYGSERLFQGRGSYAMGSCSEQRPRTSETAEFFTKGRILTIQGNVKIDQWEGKDGTCPAL